jgi:hypothetical protein
MSQARELISCVSVSVSANLCVLFGFYFGRVYSFVIIQLYDGICKLADRVDMRPPFDSLTAWITG